MDPNQNKPWYPNGAPNPGQSHPPQAPPFPPTPNPQHGLPPQPSYQPPTQPVETPGQPVPPPATAEPPQPDAPQYSIDYLNQIAPAPKKPGLDNRIFLFVIGGGLILAAIVGMLTLFSGGNGPTEKMQTLAVRMEVLQGIASKSQKNIKSNKLRNTNSSLAIFLTNANRDIETPLANNGIQLEKINKDIKTKEETDGEALAKKLEDARLNAVFDRTYANEMSYQLTTVETLMKSIYKSTKSKSMKSYLEATDKNIAPIIKQLNDFNPTTSND